MAQSQVVRSDAAPYLNAQATTAGIDLSTNSDPALLSDGTVAAPGLTFASDPDTGIYRIGANNLGIAVGGAKVLDISSTGLVVGTTGAAAVVADEVTFTETSGAGTYTGSVAVPAGASLIDILVNGVALWNNAGTATLKVGDDSVDDGYFTGVNLKATDLLAGESLSFSMAGGKAGAYIANSQVSPRYAAAARTVSGIVTTSSTGGTAGRTRMTVIYSLPTAHAATKV